MGTRAVEGFPTAQKLYSQQTLGHSIRSRDTTTVVCCSLRPCSQRGARLRKRKRIKGHPSANLLHLRTIIRSKVELYRNKKDSIRYPNLIKKAEALLPGTRDHSAIIIATRGYI